MNVLYITADQFRASNLNHPVVRTPNLDKLAAESVSFARHYNQALMCGGSRASIHSGTYMMNNRGMANGVGVDNRWTTWPLELRKQGYDPILVGYADYGIDHRPLAANDPLLNDSDGGPCPGMTPLLPWNHMAGHAIAWCDDLEQRGYDVPETMFVSVIAPRVLSHLAPPSDRSVAM
jgi:hypothetical protein